MHTVIKHLINDPTAYKTKTLLHEHGLGNESKHKYIKHPIYPRIDHLGLRVNGYEGRNPVYILIFYILEFLTKQSSSGIFSKLLCIVCILESMWEAFGERIDLSKVNLRNTSIPVAPFGSSHFDIRVPSNADVTCFIPKN